METKGVVIGIDLVSNHGVAETSTVVASEEAWKVAIEALNLKATELSTPVEGGSGTVSELKKDLANELRTLASMFALKTGLKD